MFKSRKRILFHLITIVFLVIVVLTILSTIDIVFKNNSTTLSILKTVGVVAGALASAYWGIGQAIERLVIRFKRGVLNDYFQFLLGTYFILFHTNQTPHETGLSEGLDHLKNGIYKFCTNQLNPKNYVGLHELKELPWSGKIIEGLQEDLIELPPGIALTEHLAAFYNKYEDGGNPASSKHKADLTAVFITGDPGAGKSYTLKQLTLAILESNQGLIPLYLPISTWRPDSSASNWVTNTLSELYLDKKRGEVIEALLAGDFKGKKILFLLDGLDELETANIEPFISELQEKFQYEKFIISTRSEILDSLERNSVIKHYRRYHISPLDENYIKKVLEEQKDLPQLATLTRHTRLIQELNSPLLIDLLIKVSTMKKGVIDEILKSERILDSLWYEYVKQVYHKKAEGKIYDGRDNKNKAGSKDSVINQEEIKPVKFHFKQSDLIFYAVQLAKRLKEGSEFFTIAELQPEILGTKQEQYLYALLSRLLIGLIISTGIGFLMSGPLDFLLPGLLGGLVSCFFFISSYKPLKIKKAYIYKTTATGKNIKRSFNALSGIMIYFAVTLFITGLFFSLTGQRRDMWQFLAPADLIIGLFFGIMFTILSGVHDLKYGFSDDINLIEKRFTSRMEYFDFIGAMKFGAPFGLITGLVVSSCGVLYTQNLPGNIFSRWMTETAQSWHIGLFPMLFWSVCPIAVVMGLTIGLNNPQLYRMENDSEKARLLPNYSISRTAGNSLIFALIMTSLLAVVWSWVCMKLFKTGWDAGNRGIANAIAAGLFVGLWWGWKDLIKLWVIRMILYFKGTAPFNYANLLKDLEVVGVLKRIGARFQFTHKTLKEFYVNQDDQRTIKKLSWSLPVILVFLMTGLLFRIAYRKNFYWSEASGISLICKNDAVQLIGNTKVVMTNSGQLEIKSKGLIRAGRIMGSVSPLGSETGFFGFPLNNSFDLHPNYRHSALMFHNSREGVWKAVYADTEIPFWATFPPLQWYSNTITVNTRDTITFDINDLEWQNNSKEFKVELTFLSPPANK